MAETIKDGDSLEDEFIVTLVSDVIASLERQRKHPNQQNSRDLVRTIFAAIEGLVWIYRDHVVGIARSLDKLNFEQEAALSESGYQASKTGKISKQAKFVPLPAMFRLVTRIATSLDPSFKVEFGTGKWDDFAEALSIRNRITHPKSKSDLVISAEQLETSLQAFYWLCEITVDAMATAVSAYRDNIEQFRVVLEALKERDPLTVALYRAAEQELDD